MARETKGQCHDALDLSQRVKRELVVSINVHFGQQNNAHLTHVLTKEEGLEEIQVKSRGTIHDYWH